MASRRLVALLALAPTLAIAWNADGHRQVADIAWTRLTPRTRAAVMRILASADPQFAADGSDEQKSRDAFRNLSVMPDVIKGSKTTAYEPVIDGFNRTWLPNPDPKDREQERCKTWHYYDLPIRYTGTKPGVSESNAVNAITKARSELSTMATKGDASLLASWWLGWIEHIAGDLHQPLHATSNYEKDHEEGDAGGNGVKLGISGRNGRPLALHAYWDEGIDHARAADDAGRGGTSFETTTARWTKISKLLPASARVRDQKPLDWVKEGAKLADRFVYAPGVQDGYVPTPAYNAAQEELCRREAVLGGFRLAEMLNRIFDARR